MFDRVDDFIIIFIFIDNVNENYDKSSVIFDVTAIFYSMKSATLHSKKTERFKIAFDNLLDVAASITFAKTKMCPAMPREEM